MLTHRPLQPADYPQCLALLADGFGLDDELRARLPDLWHDLFAQGAGQAAAVHDAARPAGRQIIAFGVSLFATDDFLDALLSHPAPFLARRALQIWLAGAKPHLSAPEVAAANSGPGLVLLALHSIYSPEITADEPFHRMARAMMEAFMQHHSGYRFQRLVSECFGPKRLAIHLGGGWKLRTDYADYYAAQGLPIPPTDTRPYLVEMTRADALANPGYAASTLFAYTTPCCHFHAPEQRLLSHALTGLTDDDLAVRLDLSLSTIKKRWRAIYDTAAACLPDVLPSPNHLAREQARGVEKRRRLLDYLRHHPEELRPVLPPSSAAVGSRRHKKT